MNDADLGTQPHGEGPCSLAITPKEIAALMGDGLTTFYRRRKSGDFPCKPIDGCDGGEGKRWKYNRFEVLTWLYERGYLHAPPVDPLTRLQPERRAS